MSGPSKEEKSVLAGGTLAPPEAKNPDNFTYMDLKSMRTFFAAVRQPTFFKFFLDRKCDASYARTQWIEFQNAPLMYLTYYSEGATLLEYLQTQTTQELRDDN